MAGWRGRRDPLLIVVLLIVIAGTALAWQGWKERIPTIDLVPHYLDALALVRDGVTPTRGTLSSYRAYNPPGPTWLIVPGVLATDDPRLAQLLASSLMYALTVLGIYLLARSSFSRAAALFAASIYAFSEVGLFVASTVWPRAPVQAFVVWTIYWLHRWAVGGDARALPVALVIWALGMYVFMEIAPVLLLFLLCWYCYRPPIRVRSLAIAAVVALAVWWPYLTYEAQHGYRDVRSMVLRADLASSPRPATPWCDPRLVLVTDRGEPLGSGQAGAEAPPAGAAPDIAIAAYGLLLRARGAAENGVRGMVGRTSAAGAMESMAIFVGLLTALIAIGVSPAALRSLTSRRVPYARARVITGLVAVVSAVLAPMVLVRALSADGSIEADTLAALRTLQIVLLVAGVGAALAGALLKMAARLRPALNATPPTPGGRFLAAVLLILWTALLILVEPGRSDRLWWMWPLAAIFLSALVVDVVWGPTRRRRVVATGLGVLIVALTCLTQTNMARVQSWRADGWAGADREEVRLVEYIASQVAPGSEVRIGYHLPFFDGIPSLSPIDPRFKVGAELDLILAYRYGIKNRSRCAEGFAPDDEYRLAWESSRPSPRGMYRVLAVPDPAFQRIRMFGRTALFQRTAPAAVSAQLQ